MEYEISKNEWHECRLCKSNIKDLAKIHGGTGIYYSTVFTRHLINDHSISPDIYFADVIPLCPCGVCGKKCKINQKGSSNFKLKMACGLNDGVKKWSVLAREDRIGAGNPMFQKKPWNKGIKMSKEFCDKMKVNAINRVKNGDFKFTNTIPHKKICDVLNNLNIEFINEYQIKDRFYDIFIPNKNIAIEVDGDYWHCNPNKYPNGPINNIQKRTIVKDNEKNQICKTNGITLIRFWESDIHNKIEEIECILRKLLL